MMSFLKRISPYTTGLFFPVFMLFSFAGKGNGILVFIAVGALLLQLIVDAAVETFGRGRGLPNTNRHLIKLVFAILLNSVLFAAHGYFDLSDTSARLRLLIFVVVGISLLIQDLLIISKKIPENQSEKEKSGLSQYVKFVSCFALGLVLIVVINITVIRFSSPKAPYSWAKQIKTNSELEALDNAVILFSRKTCPSCIEAERLLKSQPENNRKVLYCYDTDKFRQDGAFQKTLQKYHVKSVPTLVVIINGVWVDTYSLVDDEKSIDENAIDEAYYKYYLGISDS